MNRLLRKATYMTPYLLFACMVLSCASPTHGEEPDRTAWVLKTEKEAAATLAYFREADKSIVDIKESAKLLSFENDQTPFLTDSVNDRQCWQVEAEIILKPTYKVPVDSLDNR